MSIFAAPLFNLSPIGRATLIMVTFFFGLIGITTFAVLHKGREIAHQKQLTQQANARFESDMIWLPAGKFTMGGVGDQAAADELPLHDVKLDGFYIDKYEVTNEQFEKFVKATGYVTIAERPLSAKTTPGLLPEYEGKGASLCFRAPQPGEKIDSAYQWWEPVIGANWQHPAGPDSNLAGKEKHPVVHVCYEDAVAYGQWAGKRLPTEAEWEYAARGGLISKPFIWGSEMKPAGKWMANLWQGAFPAERRVEDGFDGTAPVGSFLPNNYGLYDMAGNVWEITADWYRPDTYALLKMQSEREARHNPKGPDTSHDPDEPGAWKKVTRGGSWMCSDNYCRGYRPSARMKTAADTGLQNTGFRCVKDGTPP